MRMASRTSWVPGGFVGWLIGQGHVHLMATGHVFVTRGNTTRLKVDAWVLPTDRDAWIEDSWSSAAFTLRACCASH